MVITAVKNEHLQTIALLYFDAKNISYNLSLFVNNSELRGLSGFCESHWDVFEYMK